MATYVLVHGGGGGAWDWHLVEPELSRRGHDIVAPDLPSDDDSAGFEEYADAVVEAIGDRTDLVVVAHSLGGFTGPIVCDRLPVDLLVLVAGMIPSPGESADEWWDATGHAQADPSDDVATLFLDDVAPDLATEALQHERPQSGTPMGRPWPLAAWPEVPTRYLLCRDDRFFPADFARRVARDRLGAEPDEIDGGHCVALSRPAELVERLEAYRVALARAR